MVTIQYPSIDRNLRKLAETAVSSDIFRQDYSVYFNDMNDQIYLNAENHRPQYISPINIFSFSHLKKEFLAFLGWPFVILEILTILNARFNIKGVFILTN